MSDDIPSYEAVIGGGISGMYLTYRLREQDAFSVFEAGSDIGGTWYWCRYPGALDSSFSLGYFFDKELLQNGIGRSTSRPNPIRSNI